MDYAVAEDGGGGGRLLGLVMRSSIWKQRCRRKEIGQTLEG